MPNTATAQEPRIVITPLKPALIEGVGQKMQLLVRVQAPDPDPSTKQARRPYHLSLVIDRSGSMSGAPLAEAVRCARHMVDRMAATDRAALIVFDDRVRTLVAAQPVGDRRALHAALAQIHSGGSTNLHGGWKAGADPLLPGAKEAAIARVVLLSDGNANVGEIQGTEEIAALCASAAEQGVTTSTYGLGRDFNEDLMVEMARRGSGNHYYGETAADLFEPFAEEFDLIASLYARNVQLSLGAPDGVRIAVANDYPIEDRGGFPVIHLPDIPWGAEAWVLVELDIPAELAGEGSPQLLQAGVTATTPEGQPIAFADATLSLGVMPPKAWEAIAADPLVAGRIAEIAAGRMLNEARQAAEHGDWETITRLIDQARRRFAEFPWVIEVLEGMADIAKAMDSARFRKEALYFARKSNTRLSAKSELVDSLISEATQASYLRRKRAQGKAQFDDPTDKPVDPSV